MSTGLEYAGFHPLLVCELNNDALGSYLANRLPLSNEFNLPDEEALQFNDAHNLNNHALTEIKALIESKVHGVCLPKSENSSLDLICGGPPCQGFSGIGHRRSYAVDKIDQPSNHLFVKMAEIIENIRPKIFLFENVKGLLSSRWTRSGTKGEVWNDVKNRFNAIDGYTTRWSLVHGKDYGVPQNRPRVLLLGIRNDVLDSELVDCSAHPEDAIKCGFLPQPDRIPPHPLELLSDLEDQSIVTSLLTGSYPKNFEITTYQTNPQTDFQKLLRTRRDGSVMKKGDPLTEHQFSKHSRSVVTKFQHMIDNNGQIPTKLQTKKFAQRVLPRKWPNGGPFITTTSLPDDFIHYSQPRSLSVREWARLQTFPDWYTFKGKRTTGGLRRAGQPSKGLFDREVPKYTQIGNAVPVLLAEAIGKHLRVLLRHKG